MTEISIGGPGARARLTRAFSARPLALQWALSGAAMLFVLCAPALWNRFPLIFPDTGGYVARPFEGTLTFGRSALYGLFLYLGIPTAFWLNVVLQAALVAWLIVTTMDALGHGKRPWLAFGAVLALSVTTSLPWGAAQLMPDILFPCAVLALYLLAFHRAQFTPWKRAAIAAVIAVAIPCHMALAGLCVGLLIALWLVTKVARDALPKVTLTWPAIGVAAGILLCPVSNYAIGGQFAFTPGGESFLFGRLVEDGIVSKYLRDRCPDTHLRLCPYRSRLQRDADDWLWDDDGPFQALGGWQGYADEERTIIADTLSLYPLLHLKAAIVATVSQFLTFQTETALNDNQPAVEALAELTPQLRNQLMNARQQSERLVVDALNLLHLPVAALSIDGIALVVMARRRLRLDREHGALCLTVLMALFLNAAICGVFSHPVDRYQSRLVWLAPFAFALALAAQMRKRSVDMRRPYVLGANAEADEPRRNSPQHREYAEQP